MIQCTLQTSRLVLIPLAHELLEYEVTLDASPGVMRYLGAGFPRDRSVVEKHHQERLDVARDGLGFWAGFLEAEFVGWWLLAPENDDARGQAELGYRLMPDFWHQGLASEGAAALLAYGVDDVGLTQIFAETMTVNAGSRAVMSRLGLTYLALATKGSSALSPAPTKAMSIMQSRETTGLRARAEETSEPAAPGTGRRRNPGSAP
ncbi:MULTISPECIES: GNAT family N-acetyltransferase [unclassified Cryobacterium]|uniref:GNAT family N-acetyltransferase n=1 Tax=unclassified Cryobacterium TaxID=2649013 RepID=UPI0018ED32C6|nr:MULTISPECIES: GNAT family N-acetyltransferase [unclassified Cryobacterium]